MQYSEVYSDDITIITNCKWLKLLKQSIEHILPAVNNDVDQNIEFDTINTWIHSLPPMIHQTFFQSKMYCDWIFKIYFIDRLIVYFIITLCNYILLSIVKLYT